VHELAPLLWDSTLETLYMVAVSAVFCIVGGLPLGVLLVVTRRDGVLEAPWLNRVLAGITNFGRSVPFIILLVAIIPFTRLVVGTSIGTNAAVVPLVVGAIPYVARLVESALEEVDPGVVEAVITMGATPRQIITRAYLPEAFPALLRGITLISYSAMAGAIGGGGLGDLAIRYGYQRFKPAVTGVTVLVLVAIVQIIQYGGDILAQHFDRR
jgi:ABC-type methionine transport system permease subunit